MPTSFAILVWNNKSRHGSVFPHNPRICSQKTIINGKNLPYNLWVTSSWSVYARECNPQKTTNFWEKRLKHLKRHVNTQFSQTPNFFWEFEFLGAVLETLRVPPVTDGYFVFSFLFLLFRKRTQVTWCWKVFAGQSVACSSIFLLVLQMDVDAAMHIQFCNILETYSIISRLCFQTRKIMEPKGTVLAHRIIRLGWTVNEVNFENI